MEAAGALTVDVPLRRAVDVPPSEAELRAGHIHTLYQQTVATLVANAMGTTLIAAMFWQYAPQGSMLGWLVAAVGTWAMRLGHHLRYPRALAPDVPALLRWRRFWQVLVVLQGAVWGSAMWLFHSLGATFHTIGLIVVIYAYCLGSVQLLAGEPRVFFAFTSLVLFPAIVRVATDTAETWHLELAATMGLLFLMILLMGRTHRRVLETAVALKVRTERLATQLRREKAVADEARGAAEAASRAKTQFFAAASHDLRQPLHAMGLFAEALRQRTHEPEVTRLVNSINESVDALEGLFAELLDITQLDSGGVAVETQPVAARELFARLKLHFEPIAFDKGLALRFHGERHVLHTDPVLVERILRNLLSNAIRYTDDGGVLVACRRRGERLQLQVWDSGVGIPADALPQVFDEFYQVQGQRALEGQHRKGLGLGLAIVKRLAELLDAPLQVRSVPGRGSMFGIELPAGRAPRAASPARAADGAPRDLTLAGRTIVVVEDERAVREGVQVLLNGWGATVHAFDSHDRAVQWATSQEGPTPDLLICDYRLPDGHNGIEVIDAVRAARGASIPAIVVTGSVMRSHEADAEAHGFHLLLKPVPPNKLRAMVAFKLGAR